MGLESGSNRCGTRGRWRRQQGCMPRSRSWCSRHTVPRCRRATVRRCKAGRTHLPRVTRPVRSACSAGWSARCTRRTRCRKQGTRSHSSRGGDRLRSDQPGRGRGGRWAVSGEWYAVSGGWWVVSEAKGGGCGICERTGQALAQLVPSRCGLSAAGQLLLAHALGLQLEHCEARGPVHAWLGLGFGLGLGLGLGLLFG